MATHIHIYYLLKGYMAGTLSFDETTELYHLLESDKEAGYFREVFLQLCEEQQLRGEYHENEWDRIIAAII